MSASAPSLPDGETEAQRGERPKLHSWLGAGAGRGLQFWVEHPTQGDPYPASLPSLACTHHGGGRGSSAHPQSVRLGEVEGSGDRDGDPHVEELGPHVAEGEVAHQDLLLLRGAPVGQPLGRGHCGPGDLQAP